MYEAIKTDGLPTQLGERVMNVESTVTHIVAELIDFASKHTSAKSAGLVISKRQCSRWIADIESLLGCGRLVRGWRIDGDELIGVISVERKQYDPYDRTYWMEVWAINVPAYQNPYVGLGPDRFSIPVDDDDPFGNGKYAFVNLGMSIVEAIVKGPIPKLTAE